MPNFDEVVRKIAEEEMPESEHTQIENFQDSTYFWANRNLSTMRKWVIHTDMMLDKPLPNTDVERFYIRLHGLVGDIHGHIEKRIEILKNVFQESDLDRLLLCVKSLKGDVRMGIYLEKSLILFRQLSKLRQQFSEFELKQIMFFRHQYCHPMLTLLSVKIDRKTRRFKNIDVDRLIREISETDEFELMVRLHAILLQNRDIIKNIDELLLIMRLT